MGLPGWVGHYEIHIHTLSFNWYLVANAVSDIRSSTFWYSQSSEALVRTTVDVVIFDRLKLLDNSEAARKLKIVSEYPIETKTKNPKVVISGRADYAIGYGGATAKSFDSALVAIEAKSIINFSTAFTQLSAYLSKFLYIIY